MKDLILIDDKEYLKNIKKWISRGRHPKELKEFLKEYADYRRVLDPLFSRYHNPTNNIFKFLVSFDYPKKITRVIEIHGRQSFNQLAKTIIKSMNWFNDHMHGFSLTTVDKDVMFDPNHYSWFAPYWEDEPHPYIHTDKVKIYHFDFEKHPKLDMTFDYGDNHHFLIEFKDKRILKPKEKQSNFPKIIKTEGKAIAQYPDRDEMTGEIIDIYTNYFDR